MEKSLTLDLSDGGDTLIYMCIFSISLYICYITATIFKAQIIILNSLKWIGDQISPSSLEPCFEMERKGNIGQVSSPKHKSQRKWKIYSLMLKTKLRYRDAVAHPRAHSLEPTGQGAGPRFLEIPKLLSAVQPRVRQWAFFSPDSLLLKYRPPVVGGILSPMTLAPECVILHGKRDYATGIRIHTFK